MESCNSMEQQQEESSPFSWWLYSHNRPPQSQWLHSTLAELDDKIKTILDLIEDNGDTFAMRAEMYYQKRPQLIRMVQDLHKSYRALADKYDQLKSESSIKASNNGSPSSSFRKVQPFQDRAKGKPQNSLSVEPPIFSSEEFSVEAGSESAGTHSSFENFLLIDSSNNKLMNNKINNEDDQMMMRDKVWNEQMKFSKLLEENLCKQAELIRRNEEKREVINELRNKNRILNQKSSGSSSHNKGRMQGNQSQKRKLRGLFCFK